VKLWPLLGGGRMNDRSGVSSTRETLEVCSESHRARSVGFPPLSNPPHQQSKLFHRLGHPFPDRCVPGQLVISVSARHDFESRGGSSDLRLRGHERGAPQHPRGAKELLR
jgi:hypothetical protein